MAVHRFVHVGLAFPGVPKMRDLEPVITSVSTDWVRYTQNGWILWTEAFPRDICAAILPHLDSDDQVLVADLNIEGCFGRISPWIWDWLNGKRPGIVTGDDLNDVVRRLLAAESSN